MDESIKRLEGKAVHMTHLCINPESKLAVFCKASIVLVCKSRNIIQKAMNSKGGKYIQNKIQKTTDMLSDIAMSLSCRQRAPVSL